MRTIIIGDVHGCYKEFLQLLRSLNYKANKDRLILLGDLMDRGPSSYEMLRWAMDRKKKNPDHFFLVRGNHEQMIVEGSKEIDSRLIWRVVGKGATLRSFRKNKARLEAYLPWILENMPIYLIDEDFRCVHAGVQYEDLSQNDLGLLVKDHSWSKKNLYDGALTIIGHTPLEEATYYDGTGGPGQFLAYDQWQPLPQKGAICIDTGCVFGNKLTAMIIEDGQYYLTAEESRTFVKNRAHFYVSLIRKFCALPIIRNYCSGSNSR